MEPSSLSVPSAIVEATRRLVLPSFFRVVTFALLFGLASLSLILLSLQQSDDRLTGYAAGFHDGALHLLQSEAVVLTLGFGFVGLFSFRLKTKWWFFSACY